MGNGMESEHSIQHDLTRDQILMGMPTDEYMIPKIGLGDSVLYSFH